MIQKSILALWCFIIFNVSFAQTQTPIDSANVTPQATVSGPPSTQWFVLTVVRNMSYGQTQNITPMCPYYYCAGVYCSPTQYGTPSSDSAIYSLVVTPWITYSQYSQNPWDCGYVIGLQSATTTTYNVDCVVYCQYYPNSWVLGMLCPPNVTLAATDKCKPTQFSSRSSY